VKKKYASDDIELLLPSFRPIARALLERMAARGHDACPFDTLRTPEQALRNAQRGTGSLQSIHMWGCAIDVICQQHGWDCAKHKCRFFQDLGAEAKALGLIWGGEWARRDMPHCQVIPVGKWQNEMRRLPIGPESEGARDALVRRYLATFKR
jgi:hypothetical protein